ncbi:unnamed protein product [Acanthosepion pharaonis]|uniref:Uncharacterized protein n=1 Tax=Acanthosepion pharaonis TaxID=158019 RepID=A0A812C9Y2_ACAPH|nr:unnamed protein product [Sepia pharaonis]
MGDPTAFPGPFSFSVGGTSVLTCFILSLRSPSAVYHRGLCPNSPQVVHLSDSSGPDAHHTCKSNTPAHIGPVWACETHNADPRLSYRELLQPSSPLPPLLSGPVSGSTPSPSFSSFLPNAASPAILSPNFSLVSPSCCCSRNNFLTVSMAIRSLAYCCPRQGRVFFVHRLL